ncbi:hypothetical protein [Mesorhizobium sp. LjNodule214]|uniref:hypothetical protein n=1 Tax=Mesorhizobium sp. LjNodule214 TaxID=3342252 RepID=UPI003ECD4E67
MTERPKVIWTAAAIGQRIGVNGDFVRSVLATEPGTPIRRWGKRLYVIEADLIEWLRNPDAT